MTNREKFKEVFGFPINDDYDCPLPGEICYIERGNCNKCPFNRFWAQTYRECLEIDMEKVMQLLVAKGGWNGD